MVSPPQSFKDTPRHYEESDDGLAHTSVKSQLSHWHAIKGREHRSFVRNIVPSFRWKTQKNSPNEIVIHNPIKLLRSVPAKGWLYFLVGWFAWTVSILIAAVNISRTPANGFSAMVSTTSRSPSR